MQNSSVTTTLKMVSDLNRCFGNKPWHEIEGDKPSFHSYLNGQVSLIIEEMYDELSAAEVANDNAGMLDAIGDSITVIDGLAHKAGFIKSERGFSDLATHCNVLGALVGEGTTLFPPLAFQTIPSFISEAETARIAFGLWSSHRAFIEAYAIQKGFDPLKVYKEVHDSNMSKFCAYTSEVEASLHKYTSLHSLSSVIFAQDYQDGTVDITHVEPQFDLRVEEVNGIYVIKTNREIKMGEKVVKAGKFLKGINFKEPDFSNPGRFELSALVAPSI